MALSKMQLEAQCKYRLKNGQRREIIHEFLVKEGMTDSTAKNLISESYNILRQKYYLNIIIGFILVAAGVSIYLSDIQLLFWVHILIGLVLGINGVAKLLKLK
jgi:hypothetical protein